MNTPECAKRATSVSVQLLRLRKDLQNQWLLII